jgi:threonine dehydrogenase-like Zn-dependent dehydrogenase
MMSTMQAATHASDTGFDIREVPVPRVGPGELLVRVRSAAICGTDLKIMRHGSRRAAPGQRLVLGHEFAGTVEESGAGVTGYPSGLCVGVAPNFGCGRCDACIRGLANMCAGYSAFGIDRDGAHAPYVCVPAAAVAQGNVVALPPRAVWAEVALAEPLSCVFNAQRGARLAPGERVLIYGAGPMGLLHVLLAVASGASAVVVVDPDPRRRAAATALGATAAVEGGMTGDACVRDVLGEHGADVVFLAVSVPAPVPEALKLLAPFGRLCLFAGLIKGQSEVALDANLIHYRNLVVTGSSGGSNADYRAALDLIVARRVDVRPVISHTFALTQLREAYDMALSGQGLKIVLTAE